MEQAREPAAPAQRKLFLDKDGCSTSSVADQVQFISTTAEEIIPSAEGVEKEIVDSRTTWYSVSPPKVIEVNQQRTTKVRVEETVKKKASTASGVTQKKSPFKIAASKIKKGLAQTKLTLMKPTKTEVIRHPNPFAAKNIYYDELWMEKQELAFTRWMNFVLSPPEEFNTSDVNVEVNAAKLWIDSLTNTVVNRAPTKEDISLQAYTTIRHLNKLRRAACLLFQSKQMATVISRVEAEIFKKRLAIREDRGLHADYGIKQDILSMLLCYNPLWLRIGLETLYGELLPLASNSDVLGLSSFIVRRFLHSPELATRYGHPSVPNLFRAGFEEELKVFILKKFLLLILFLDAAKLKHLIDHDPCLFNKNAKIKSSKVMLLTFSKEYLKGEGDILRHLRHLDYRVEWEQKPREEFDYSVTNIAVDLRCGLRIARVIELMLHSWDLITRLRAPAVGRLHKISNMELVFKELRSLCFEIESTITPRDIVDGHREKTLQLVWKLIFKTQVEVLIDKKRLRREINYLSRSLNLLGLNEDVLDCKGVRPLEIFKQVQQDCIDPENESLSLLLTWVQAVCAHYKVKVENFGASFADGRAFCYIIHYYHPDLLLQDDICSETTLTRHAIQSSSQDANDSLSESFMFMQEYSPTGMQKALQNEKTNLALAFDKMKTLGGIPILTSPKFMSNTIPDEKVMITFLTYLQARLLSLSEEIQAARIIQLAWRNKQVSVKMEKKKAQDKAARLIQHYVKSFLERRRLAKQSVAALAIQCAWRRWKACKKVQALRQEKLLAFHHKMATAIQVAFCNYSFRKKQLQANKSAVVIQSHVRGWLSRRKYLRYCKSAIVIQQHFRAMKAGQYERDRLKAMKRSVVLVQSHVRGWMARKSYLSMKSIIVGFQSRIRGNLVRLQLLKSKQASIRIQQAFRAHTEMKACRKDFLAKRNACVVLQRSFRARKERKNFCKQKCAAVLIQSHIRGILARNRYQRLKCAVLVIQRRWKSNAVAKREHRFFLRYRNAAITIQTRYRALLLARFQRKQREKAVIILQAFFRMIPAKRKYLLLKNAVRQIEARQVAKLAMRSQRKQFLGMRRAAIVIQQMFRAYREMKCCKEKYLKQKRACSVLQQYFRAQRERRNFLKQVESAIILQSHIRAFLANRKYQKLKFAANVIQLHWRATVSARKARFDFLQKRTAAMTIQSCFRSWKTKKAFRCYKQAAITIQTRYRALRRERLQRQEYVKLRSASITIQKAFRGYQIMKLCRNEYHRKKTACVVLQKFFRAYKERKSFLKQKAAAIMIQSNVRSFLSSRKYQRLKQAATVFQVKWKATLTARMERQVFLEKRNAAKIIQSHYRSWKARTTFLRHKQAIVSIQMRYRALLLARFQRQEYLKVQFAAVAIQRSFRGYRKQKLCRSEYLRKKRASVVLQKCFRAYRARKDFLRQKAAAVEIQSCVRSFLSRRKYQNLKGATQIIQSKWRATLTARKERKIFLEKRNAAKIIQSYYRSWKARTVFLRYKQAAISVQVRYRALLLARFERRKYLRLKNAAVTIQRAFLGCKMTKLCRNEYCRKKVACVVLQKCFREYRERKTFLKKKAAAITIQSCVRSFLSTRRYQRLKEAAQVIQSKWKATLTARKERQVFLEKRNSAKIIQSHYRTWKVRTSFLHYKQAAVSIQMHYRALQLARFQRREYLKLRFAAVTIQRSYQGYRKKKLCRREYQYQSASIVLQKSFRAYRERKKFLKQKAAAVTIQSYVRSFLSSRKYQSMKGATKVIQQKWRATIIANKERQMYLNYRQATVAIQILYRAKLLARSRRQEFAKFQNAVVTVQAYFRMKLVRKKYLLLKCAVKRIETLQVEKLAMRSQRKQFLAMRHAAITIQQAFRGSRQMKLCQTEYLGKKGACIVLQKCFRAYLERKKILEQKAASVIVQSHIRCFLARRRYQKMKHAAKVIQLKWRATLASRKVRHAFVETKNAAKLIQSHFLCWKARRTFRCYRQAAVAIQTRYRALLLARFQRQEYLRLRSATITIQQAFRGYKRMKQCRTEYLRKKMACVVLQRHFKEHHIRNFRRLSEAAIILQRFVRCFIQRKGFNKKKQAAITIQSAFRMMLVRKRYLQMHTACIQIQTFLRMYWERKKYTHLQGACILIQAQFRMIRVRKNYMTLKWAAVQVQRQFREKLYARKSSVLATRKDMQSCLMEKEEATAIIQNVHEPEGRKMVLFCFASRTYHNLCAIKIQRCFRKRQVLLRARAEEQAVVIIQRWSRFCLLKIRLKKLRRNDLCQEEAAAIVQSAVRTWLSYRRKNRAISAAFKIQAAWRGFRQRSCENTCQMAIIRSRLSDATAAATDDKKLYFRTSQAIDTILHSKGTTRICVALLSLDRITSLDGKCCERIGEAGLVDLLIELLQYCNRSLTHIEIITYSVNILVNLSKYDKTFHYVWSGKRIVETILNLMKIYSEKPGIIFRKLCTLLWILLRGQNNAELFLAKKTWVSTLCSISTILKKKTEQTGSQNKLKVSSQMDTPGGSADAQSVARFLSTPSLESTMSRSPNFRPAWFLSRKDVSEFSNPVHAMRSVMNILKLNP